MATIFIELCEKLTSSIASNWTSASPPLGRSSGVSLDWVAMAECRAAVAPAPPAVGLVASNSTLSEAIACSCVAFSSTLPADKIGPVWRQKRSSSLGSYTGCWKSRQALEWSFHNIQSICGNIYKRPCLGLSSYRTGRKWK